MKRRQFLSMIGATAAVPALSAMPASALSAKLKAMGMAHAHKYPMVSVMGISRRMKIPQEQAQQMLSYLFDKGVIGKSGIQGTGITSAASRVFRPVPHQVAGVKSMRDFKLNFLETEETREQVKDTTDWLTHLRVICVQNGFELSPRALAGVAA